MFPKTLHFSILKLTKLLQRSNLCTLSHNNPLSKPSNTSIRQRIMNHRDWLSTSDTLKMLKNLRDPSTALEALNVLSERKDYNPNEEIYSMVLKKLAKAKKYDLLDALLEKIKFEKKCSVSENFFYDVIKVYGVLGGRFDKAIQSLYDMQKFGCLPDVKTLNLVLNLLVVGKQFKMVHEVFLKATELGVVIDACCLNILIKGLCKCGRFDAAFDVMQEFDEHGLRPNAKTFSTIMVGLCKCGRVDEALEVFDRMEKEGVRADTVTFNILIRGVRKDGKYQEGIDLMDRMLYRGCKPTRSTYVEGLFCFIDSKRFEEAKEFIGKMGLKRVRPSFVNYKAMLDGLCKENDVENVDWALNKMVFHGFKPNMETWKKIVICMLSSSGTDFSVLITSLTKKL